MEYTRSSVENLFTADFFINNRRELRRRCDNEGPIIIAANGLVQRAGDSGFSFRQDSNFWYLTGIELADVLVVITKTDEFLVMPPRSTLQDFFDGKIDRQSIKQISGVDTLLDQHEGWQVITRLALQHKVINTGLYKGYDERHSLYLNPAKPRLVSQLKKIGKKIELKDIRLQLTHMRMTKQDPELRTIQRAVDITVSTFKEVFRSDWYQRLAGDEHRVAAELTYGFGQQAAVEAYPMIVAGGARACTLHYDKNNQKLDPGELLLVDAGAEYGNYAADITRVYAPTKFTARQRAVYDAVKEIQDYAISLIKPGADIYAIDKKVESKIGRFLKSQKLITRQDSAEIRRFYPHAISHHLGLDVHDVADYSVPLAKGMVLTVEPGIYIPEWEIGVRLEDDILVTETGRKNLSSDLPR